MMKSSSDTQTPLGCLLKRITCIILMKERRISFDIAVFFLDKKEDPLF